MNKRVLIVAAHPDDEVLGCGGLIAKYRAKEVDVRVIFLAEGVTSRYDTEELSADHVLIERDRRNSNAIKALKILSVDPSEIFTSTRNCCRFDQILQLDLVKEIEQHISEWSPTHLYTHSPDDVNIDHRITYQAVLAASRPIASSTLLEIYSFEVLSSTEWNTLKPFKANTFVDISSYIDLKISAMEAYEGEFREEPHPRSKTAIQALSRYRGAQSGLLHAEAFSLVRMLKL
jgi:LmbE family N-acetylglucosaminyl deacetylase